MSVLSEIQQRVHGYWTDAPAPDHEIRKHRLVRETCELAKEKGLTEAELEEWAQYQQGQPSVGVVSANALIALQDRLNKPFGPTRFRARLERERAKRLR